MNVAATVFDEAVTAGLLLSRHGERIRVDSPLGRPLPEDLKRRITSHRGELLVWLDWCETADGLLLGCSRRIAGRYPPGCPLEDEEWRAAEETLNIAHRSQDLAVFRQALAHYERFAVERFRAYESGAR